MKGATKLRWWIQIIAEIRRAGFSRCWDIQPFYFTNPLTGFRTTDSVYLGTGIQDAPDKENGTRLNIANQEDEGAVYGDVHKRFGYCC
jgi:hypothetical protein